jgi:citrate synthase
MTSANPAERIEEATEWWSTAIIDMKPGVIHFRGYPIEQLIGNVSFPQMIWLLLRGELPSADEAALLEAALVSAVDHGPQAPSIAIGRMAVTCGLPLNGAIASAVNVLDDVHGGAGEQCVALYVDIDRRVRNGEDLVEAVGAGLDAFAAANGALIPGFGHRFHPVDPRSPRLMKLVDDTRAKGGVSGRFADIGRAVEEELARRKGRRIPMNIDGATAVIYAELGFAPPLARGLFVLSRSVGVLAHAWEQTQQGGRIKGPMPPDIPYRYTGAPERPLPRSASATAWPGSQTPKPAS